MWRSTIISKWMYSFLIGYRVPTVLSYNWSYGGVCLILLLGQMVTGIVLASRYSAGEFEWVISDLWREVFEGWWMRLMHVHGASLFFFFTYVHIARGLVFGLYMYPKQYMWISGVSILLLMVITALLGYLLPWGHMSYWATMIMLSFIDGAPTWKDFIMPYVMGGFGFDQQVLYRCFSFHYFFSFVLLGGGMAHLVLLHECGSTNNLGYDSGIDSLSFSFHFLVKDMLSVFFLLFVFSFVVGFRTFALLHENFIVAKILVTPDEIKPEWYFMPFYGFIKMFPNKWVGLCVMLVTLSCLYWLAFFGKPIFRGVYFDSIVKYIGLSMAFNFVDIGLCANNHYVYPRSLELVKAILYFFTGNILLYVYWHHESFSGGDDFLIYLGKKKEPRKFVVFSRWFKIPSRFISFWLELYLEKEEKYFVFFYDIDKFFKATGFYKIITEFIFDDWHGDRDFDDLWLGMEAFIVAKFKEIKQIEQKADEFNDKINNLVIKKLKEVNAIMDKIFFK